MLDSHQLNVFLIAAQTLNFSEAARRLNMTQPSVSQHIQTLEKRFGTRLFDRNGRHLSLTDSGEALVPMARRLVNDSIQIEEAMASLRGEVFGHLDIGCCTTAGRFLLPRLLANYRIDYPNVHVTCHVTDLCTAVDRLTEGKLHLAMTSDRDLSKDLEYLKFASDPVILITPPDHPWALRGSVEPAELLTADFISREETSGTYIAVANALPTVGLSYEQLNTIMVLGTSQAVSMAVQEGIGVAFVTRLAAQAPLARGEVAVVEIPGLTMEQEVFIGRNPHYPSTGAQSAFWEFITDPQNEVLQEAFAENGEPDPLAA